MKAIMLMFDSLNRRLLEPYGSTESETPNFQRLAKKCLVFDHCYVGSMPCIPARKELHTGRHNFLHRSWGPLEPYDDSVPELLKKNGIHTHLVTDHKHYWRDGGATYHNRYSTYEFIRGQAGDLWIGQVNQPEVKVKIMDDPDRFKRRQLSRSQDLINRAYHNKHQTHQLVQTFDKGFEFLDMNKGTDQWFLQIECFDPHEPYFVQEEYRRKFHLSDEFDGWAPLIIRSPEEGDPEQIRQHYKALLSMVDDQIGRFIDKMDELKLWDDVMVILNTDHGCFLGEHDWWYMGVMPLYNEMANIPLMIHYPQSKDQAQHSKEIVQNIDIPVTLLDYFKIKKPESMKGVSILPVFEHKNRTKNEAFFGYFGGDLNVTDGRYVYMRAPLTKSYDDVYEYTLTPTHINKFFSVEELKRMEMVGPLPFTKDCPVLKIKATEDPQPNAHRYLHRLFDLETDPYQNTPIDDPKLEIKYCQLLKRLLDEHDAPVEIYKRYGLSDEMTETTLLIQRETHYENHKELLNVLRFADQSALEKTIVLYDAISVDQRDAFLLMAKHQPIDETWLKTLLETFVESGQWLGTQYQMDLYGKVK